MTINTSQYDKRQETYQLLLYKVQQNHICNLCIYSNYDGESNEGFSVPLLSHIAVCPMNGNIQVIGGNGDHKMQYG